MDRIARLTDGSPPAAAPGSRAAAAASGHRRAAVTLDGLRKVYRDGTVAVDNLSLEVHPGEVVVLIGPSGCGKSTVLRMINRLIEPTGGRVLIDGADVRDADPVQLRRGVGYVIQNVGLFPHQTVLANVATVPRLLGWDRRRIAERTAEMLELVGLDPQRLGARYPNELSGGQRQRVGVARALAADPGLLLMDEPFSAVDPIARTRLQDEFLRLRRAVGTTTVLVTHDLDEAIRVADRIAVLADHAGLRQLASPDQLLAQPVDAFVATFVGADRGIKRLAVTPIPATGPGSTAPGSTDPGSAGPGGAADVDGWPAVDASGSLRDALAAMLAAGTPGVLVHDGDAAVRSLTAADVVRALRAGDRS